MTDEKHIEAGNWSTCENCEQAIKPGQVVIGYRDAGEIHSDCDRPFSLDTTDPRAVVLLGDPMLHYPLPAIGKAEA